MRRGSRSSRRTSKRLSARLVALPNSKYFGWGVNNVKKTNALWRENKGEVLALPPQEQASMMRTFALGANIIAQNPAVKSEMDKLQTLFDARRPK